MFSRTSEYAIKAVVYIALRSNQDQRIKLNEISEAIDSPVAFSGKILHKLATAGIIKSSSGPRGGFFIDKKQQAKTHLSKILKVMENTSFFEDCVLGLKECGNSNPCPMHHVISETKGNLKKILDKTTIADLVIKVEKGQSFLKLV